MTPSIFGHEEIEKRILQDFQNNKLHHAILFSGPRSIGKAHLATKLALEIIASARQNDFNFNENNLHNNPDLLIIKREPNQKKELKKDITIDSIRKINDFINLTSARSKYRVIIIDAADEMNRNSANALLKTLEEPPANVFLFLISHNHHQLPKTIKSRCSLIKMLPLNYSNFTKALNQIDPILTTEQLKNLFIISQGSIDLALKLHQHHALKLYDEIISHQGQTELINKIIQKDFSWEIFEQLIRFYLNRLAKTIFQVKIQDYVLPHESQKLIERTQNHPPIWDIGRKVNQLFVNTKNFNLDLKQSAINILNLIYE